MDISKTRCASCSRPMTIAKMVCEPCNLSLEGTFQIPPLASLTPEDQLFVSAFVRHHGSLKKMEELFDISYPTVKNRLNAIAAALDKTFRAPSPNAAVLEQLSRGEITVEEALERMGE
ncbi:MAG: hypothetical protein FD180_2897 [Planctomycetota bacterium]|nr:MAG: hypothetical protein FD180_2897 [Planctomycetota bacterium]